MIRIIILCVACISVACFAFADVYVVPTNPGTDYPDLETDPGNACLSIQKGESMVCRNQPCQTASGYFINPEDPVDFFGNPIYPINYTHYTHTADFDTLECRPSLMIYICVGRLNKPCVTGKYYACHNNIPTPCWAGTHVATQIITTTCCRSTREFVIEE